MPTKKNNKKVRITRKMYLDKLKKKYPICIHDDVKKSDFGMNNVTYGEMNYDGIEKLYKYVKNKYPNIKTFIDIGSGRGKLCIHMSSFPKIKKSIGIEIVRERHNDALKLLKTTQSEYSKKIEFINDDIFNINLNDHIDKNGSVFVWWSNLCFDQSVTDAIYDKLIRELPKGSVICCSKNNRNDNPVDSIIIPMSWSHNSNVLIYEN